MSAISPWDVRRALIDRIGPISAKGWTTKPLKAFATVRNERGRSDLQLLSVYRDHGVVPREGRDDNYNKPGDDLGQYKVVRPGDLVINKMKAWQGSLGISAHFGIVSPAYIVCSTRGANAKWLEYLLRSPPYFAEYARLSAGIRPNQWDIQFEDIMNIPTLLPPTRDQAKIAAFLDHHTARIDVLIAKKRRLLELLEEKRQALVSRAVTKGLDPTVSMKDSGVPWLGEVPEHWKVASLRRFLHDLCDGPFGSSLTSAHYEDRGVRVIRLGNIGAGFFRDEDKAFIPHEYFQQLRSHEALPGDILIAGLGDGTNPLGRACLLPEHIPVALVKADCFRARATTELRHGYLVEFLNSGRGSQGIAVSTRGATRSRINLDVVRELELPIPPPSEQEAIAGALQEIRMRQAPIAGAISRSTQLLLERRSALITAAVTGQLDVTNWQPPAASEAPA